MKMFIFSVLLVGVLLCSSIAYASEAGFEGGIGGFVEEIGMISDSHEPYPVVEDLVISDDVPTYDLTQKNVSAPLPPSWLIPNFESSSPVSGTAQLQRRGSSLNNTTPNSAVGLPLNSYCSDTLDTTRQQAWFYTQVTQAGQLTVHLGTINSTSVDYDLYVYQYSNGSLYSYKSSTYNPTVDEHISFRTTGAGIYFILVVSYSGSSTTPYTLYNNFTASPDSSEVDDFYTNARVMSPNSKISGNISMPNDEDFVKFTITEVVSGDNPMVVLRLNAAVNPYISGSLYTENLTYAGELGQDTETFQRFPAGTYYIKLHSTYRTGSASDNSYTLFVNSFDCEDNTIAAILGRRSDNTKIAYVTNSSVLWVNSESIMLLGSPSFSLNITVPISSVLLPPNSTKTSYFSVQSVSAVTSAQFGHHYSNCSQSGAGWSLENALALIPSGNIQFLNSISTPDPLYVGPSSDGGTFNNTQEGEAGLGYSAFILDLNTKQIKDFTSIHNGFYNPSLLGGIMGNYNCNFTVY